MKKKRADKKPKSAKDRKQLIAGRDAVRGKTEKRGGAA